MEHFALNMASGMIRTRHRELDRERITTFDLSIRAFLPGQDPPLEAETLVVIDLIDINDNRPMFTEGVYDTVGIDTDELDTSVSLINDIFASDIDIGPNAAVVYSIHTLHLNQTLQNDPSAFFILNSTTARLYPASLSIPTGTYILNISGSDQGTPVQSGYTSLAVVIQRPAPTSIAFTDPSGYTFTLNENTGSDRLCQGHVGLNPGLPPRVCDLRRSRPKLETLSSVYTLARSPLSGALITR